MELINDAKSPGRAKTILLRMSERKRGENGEAPEGSDGKEVRVTGSGRGEARGLGGIVTENYLHPAGHQVR